MAVPARVDRRHPLVISAAVALTAVLVATLLGTVMSARARGAGTALCERHQSEAAARAEIRTGSGREITVIGDSWTVGLGLNDLGASWPSMLPGQVRVAGFSGSGFAADSSTCGDHGFATRAGAARDADLVVVAGGLNDFDQPDAEIRRGFADVLAGLRGRRVVVVGPASAPARGQSVRRVDATLARLSADYAVSYVDTSGWLLDYLPDRLHLTEAGHADFGRRVSAELALRGLLD